MISFVDLLDAGFDPRQIEQVFDQPLQAIGLRIDHGQELFASFVVFRLAIEQQFDISTNSSQGRFHLVTGRRYEFGMSLLDPAFTTDVCKYQ